VSHFTAFDAANRRKKIRQVARADFSIDSFNRDQHSVAGKA
jgi:hypothetical protein